MSAAKSRVAALALLVVALAGPAAAQPAAPPAVAADGTVQVPAFAVPLSSYMSDEARRSFIAAHLNPPPIVMDQGPQDYRDSMDRYFFAPRLAAAKARYRTTIRHTTVAGIPADVVLPADGVSAVNRDRVLINLHGGGFRIGAGMGGLVESIPLAALGRIKVLSVDYRQGPEHAFPAASEDVAAVYRDLLKRYRPENIGIYGTSAGGMLSAMVVPWFAREKLPAPGAIGLFCAGADAVVGGDARWSAQALSAAPPPPPSPNPPPTGMPYAGPDVLYDPLVSPAFSLEALKGFPPTLLLVGTRDGALSSAAFAQRQLTRAGVEAELHAWDGLWHCFLNEVDLPESQEAFAVAVRFFDRHLGRRAGR
jgi:acetyl esterase/lipase